MGYVACKRTPPRNLTQRAARHSMFCARPRGTRGIVVRSAARALAGYIAAFSASRCQHDREPVCRSITQAPRAAKRGSRRLRFVERSGNFRGDSRTAIASTGSRTGIRSRVCRRPRCTRQAPNRGTATRHLRSTAACIAAAGRHSRASQRGNILRRLRVRLESMHAAPGTSTDFPGICIARPRSDFPMQQAWNRKPFAAAGNAPS